MDSLAGAYCAAHEDAASDDPAADAALQCGIESLVRWRADAGSHLDAALARDPQAPLAHLVKGLLLAGGRCQRFHAPLESALVGAQRGAARLNDAGRLYLRALEAQCAGRPGMAAAAFEALLLDHPGDALAHRLLQQELFWLGERQWMLDVVERSAGHWPASHPALGILHAVQAFSLEENGHLAAAEHIARRALEDDPGNIWATHAVAHVQFMQGRFDEGAEWLEPRHRYWAGGNQLVHHLWWHLCLFLLEQHAHERMLELLVTRVRDPDSALVQAVPDAYIDLQNVASLLLRLELRGVDVGEHWQTVADVSAARVGDHSSPFTSAHAVMVLAACGQFDRAEALIQDLAEFAAEATPLAPRVLSAALPAARAVLAHRRAEHAGVVEALLPARRDLWQMGGSHAQRDVFAELLFDAARRCGRDDATRLVLADLSEAGFARVEARTLYGAPGF